MYVMTRDELLKLIAFLIKYWEQIPAPTKTVFTFSQMWAKFDWNLKTL